MITYEKAINKIADTSHYSVERNRQDSLQRRHQVTEIYGQEYTAQGDANSPAVVYFPVSRDLVYHEVFEIQLRVTDFQIPVANGKAEPAELTIEPTSLATQNNGQVINPNPHGHKISPNPHEHVLKAGITNFASEAKNFKIMMDDIDLTEAIKKHYSGNWIDGPGIFPKSDDGLLHYNILDILPYFESWQQNVILSCGLKEIKIYGDAPFKIVVSEYLKFSHRN